ncbi:GroES-like protein [Periconia macrospinosa]|uniref:D-xylulose reductase n=1 Tax=Periconia macrospinosa TaxID=97972 RepID=A0A2V1D2N4_9PLEO|nr:GroES-like protein [Periconia macrospinosa]
MTPSMQNPSIVLYGPGKAKVEDKPIPEITDGHDVIIRIGFVGVCGSDVHFWNHGGIGKHVNPDTGIVMGHEASGTVHSIGPLVTTLTVGDRVALEPGTPCRYCRACKSGSYHLCKYMRFAAAPGPPDTHGTLSKYFKIAEDFAYKIPEWMSLEEAVLVEPTSVAVHAVKLADVKPGEVVVVMGSGTIGLLVAAVAKAFGAGRIALVDILDRKLQFAKGFLECDTFKSDIAADAQGNASKLLSDLGLEGVDAVIEASGAASSVDMGIHVLRSGGKYVQTGMGRPRIEFPIGMMAEKELSVKGCFRYNAGDYELAVDLLSRKKIDVKQLISSTSPFEETTAAWEKTKNGEGIKNLIRGVED